MRNNLWRNYTHVATSNCITGPNVKYVLLQVFEYIVDQFPFPQLDFLGTRTHTLLLKSSSSILYMLLFINCIVSVHL